MNSLLTRAISAVVALILLFSCFHFLGIFGLKLIATLAVVIGTLELNQMLFDSSDSKFIRTLFCIFNFLIFLLSVLFPAHGLIVFGFFCVSFCLISLLAQKKFDSLHSLSFFQQKALLGFIYVGTLPSFAIRLLDIPNGLIWFLGLLGIVFSGDIGAYVVGLSFGKRKLMPLVSPKKTIEGALGGLVASMTVGFVLSQYLTHIPALHLALLALSTGIFAQFGDLFESQLKRVADIKDSGSIMPGHGGVLDRIDGVLFASPILLFGAVLLEGIL